MTSWDIRNIGANARNFQWHFDNKLKFKSIRKLTASERAGLNLSDNNLWPYLVEFENDIIYPDGTRNTMMVYPNTYDFRTGRIYSDIDVFHFFIGWYFAGSESVERACPTFHRYIVHNGQRVFQLASDTTNWPSLYNNETANSEKYLWDGLGYTSAEDLIQENKIYVDRGISKAQREQQKQEEERRRQEEIERQRRAEEERRRAEEEQRQREERERREREERQRREEAERRERERIQQLLQQQRQNALQAVKDHWNTNATSGKINNQDQNSLLGSNWETTLNSQTSESAINTERARLKELINNAKKAEQTQQQQTQTIAAIENHWKQNQDSDGKINGQTIEQTLGSNWKENINALTTSEGIKTEQNRLTGLINQVKEEEKKKVCTISEHQNYSQLTGENEQLKKNQEQLQKQIEELKKQCNDSAHPTQITQQKETIAKLQAEIKRLHQVIGIEEDESERMLQEQMQTLTVQDTSPPRQV